jgi:deazaflavin-dependent oxidoreductase (nitroreductase family)
MAYLKPPAFTAKVFNPIASRLGIGGATELVVRGRRSGDPRSVPVIPVAHGGHLHVVSTRGEAEWVRNLRAAGRCDLKGKHSPGSYFAVEVPTSERADVVAAYRQKAGKTVEGYWRKLPDDADHPVFRLTAV